MIVIGVLLIAGLLFDGYRRVRNERRGNIRMSLNSQFINSASLDEEPTSELPNGGARPAVRTSVDTIDREIEPPLGDGELDLEQSVPMLMESVDRDSQEGAQAQSAATKGWDAELDTLQAGNDNRDDNDEFVSRSQVSSDNQADDVFELQPPPSPQVAKVELSSSSNNEVLQQTLAEEANTQEANTRDANTQVTKAADIQEVLVINVVAKDEPFKGPDLLHILLACDLRFGDMNIFHRYEQANGGGAKQFSMANSVEPGYFDLDNIDDFTTPGVCFFLSVPGPEQAITAFEYMVETAQCLVTNLNGEMLDESRSAMTNQTLEHCRQRLQEFERRQLTQSV